MLDSDLATLYQVTTSNLNKAVRRNPERFPREFMFQLTNQEVRSLQFQTGTSSDSQHGGRRNAPYAFTQEGVAMLSSVLRSKRAISVNIAIMRAFIKIKETLISHEDLSSKLEGLEKKYDHQFKVVFKALQDLMSDKRVPRKRILGLSRDA